MLSTRMNTTMKILMLSRMIKMTLMVKQVMMKARWSVHVSVD